MSLMKKHQFPSIGQRMWVALGLTCFTVGMLFAESPPMPVSPSTPPLPLHPFSVQWEFDTGEAIEATPAVSGGRVFVADVMGKVTAIDQATGTQLWSKDFDTGFIASPSIKNDTLVIGDFEGNLYALSVDDGSVRWQKSTEGEINGTASFYKEFVLVTSQDGKLYAYALSDGSLQWTYQTNDQIRSSPAIAGNRTFLGGCDAQLHVVNLDTGKAAGSPLPLGGPTGSTPAVHGNLVFLPIMDGAVFAFDWKTQKQIWKYEDEETHQEYRSSPAANDEVVVVSSARKHVDALSVKTGRRLWRHTLRRRADASPVIHGKDVFLAGTDGRLIRLDLKDGTEEQWSYEIRGSFVAGPVMALEKLFIADDRGVVRCFGNDKSGLPEKTRDQVDD